MDFNKAALEMHESHHGKVGIVSKVEVRTRDDLSTAYTPGVAEPCRKIRENPDDVYKYTFKSNMVAVVSNGTAVLGLGDIGPEAGMPVMEGKCVLFKAFGDVDAFPICVKTKDVDEFVETVYNISGNADGARVLLNQRYIVTTCAITGRHGGRYLVGASVAAVNAVIFVNKRLVSMLLCSEGSGHVFAAFHHAAALVIKA